MILWLGTLVVFTACADQIDSIGQNTDQTAQYIVVFKSSSDKMQISSADKDIQVQSQLKALSIEYNVVESLSFSRVLAGGVYRLNKSQLEKIKKDPMVAYVEPDYIATINESQTNPSWGLDRIDQAGSSLDKTYSYQVAGKDVNAYIIDTGIVTNHVDFGSRAVSGYDAVDNDNDAADCNGHGTHVAGTVGGTKYGVAKEVNLIAVRVLGCSGSGSYSGVIKGIEWVTKNHKKPAVANMSLGGPVSQALEDAMKASIQAGVTYVVAAGNEKTDACNSSPSRLAEAITVGSIEKNDKRSSFSNWGTCLDVFAPGTDILSAWYTSSTATNTISGTSMAAPHVAGVAALVLSVEPDRSPAEVADIIVKNSLSDKISDVKTGSPNKLVNTEFIKLPVVDPPVDDDSLKVGDVIADLSGVKGEEQSYKLVVPKGLDQIEVIISEGSGDADLYVKINDVPSLTSYSCRPYAWGNFERCTFKNPKEGTYHIMLRAYSNYGGVKLSIQ